MPRLHQRNPRRPRINGHLNQRPNLRRLPQKLPQNRPQRSGAIIPQASGRSRRQSPPSRINNRPTNRKRHPMRGSRRTGNMRFHINSQSPGRAMQQPLVISADQRRGNSRHHPTPQTRHKRPRCQRGGKPVSPWPISLQPPKRPLNGLRNNQRARLQIGRQPTRRPETNDPRAAARNGRAQRPLQQIGASRVDDLDVLAARDARFERHTRHHDHRQGVGVGVG